MSHRETDFSLDARRAPALAPPTGQSRLPTMALKNSRKHSIPQAASLPAGYCVSGILFQLTAVRPHATLNPMVNRSAARLDRVFSALGDPTRRGILQRLARGGATISELAEPLPMSLPAVSKHLRILE